MKTASVIAKLSVMAAAAMLIASSAQATTTVAYWRFSQDGGNPVINGQAAAAITDSSGNGYTLSVSSGTLSSPVATYAGNGLGVFPNPVPQTGAPNNFYLVHNGANGYNSGSYIHNSALNNTVLGQDYTIEGFFDQTGANTTGLGAVFTAGDGTGHTVMLLEEAGVGGSLSVSLGSYGSVTTSFVPSLDTTYHFAVVMSNEFVYVYVNDVLEAGPVFYAAIATWNGFELGDRTSDDQLVFNGNLDEIRISDAILTPGQFLDDAPVPEPSTLLLLGMGGIVLWLRRRNW